MLKECKVCNKELKIYGVYNYPGDTNVYLYWLDFLGGMYEREDYRMNEDILVCEDCNIIYNGLSKDKACIAKYWDS